MVKQKGEATVRRGISQGGESEELSHLPTPGSQFVTPAIDSDRAGYQEFSNFKGRYTTIELPF